MKFLLWPLLALAMCASAFAAPAQIILMRHAEKPASGDHLSDRGWERASALPSLFHSRSELLTNGLPVALYAMAPDDDEQLVENGTSVRATETLQYLAQYLRLVVRAKYSKYKFPEMLKEIKNDQSLDGKTIVICWERKVLTDIAKALNARGVPKLSKKQFDRIWLLTLSDEKTEFEDLPQRLLSGDSFH